MVMALEESFGNEELAVMGDGRDAGGARAETTTSEEDDAFDFDFEFNFPSSYPQLAQLNNTLTTTPKVLTSLFLFLDFSTAATTRL